MRWAFFAANADELDALYDQLVKLRHGMALQARFFRPSRRLVTGGCGGSITVRTMSPAIASRSFSTSFPWSARLLEARRADNGWDRLRFWDEALVDPAGNPDAGRRS